MTDRDALTTYRHSRNPADLTPLIQTHIHLVYSVARRISKDATLAEDITQEVFLTFAKKAHTINPDIPLPGWLFTTTRLLSLQTLRAQSRRTRHETEAAMSQPPPETPDPLWPLIAHDIDAAIADLPPTDRDALLLRYFTGLSTTELALTLSISEEAAKKRTQRALDSLQKILTSRGLAPTTAALLAAALTTHAVHAAPPALASTVASTLTAKTAAALATKGTLMAAAKLKITLIAAATLTLITIPTAIYFSTRNSLPVATPVAQSTSPAPQISAAPDDYAAAYALPPNKYLALVTNVDPAARTALYRKAAPQSTFIPGSIVARWQNDKIFAVFVGGDDGYPLNDVVSHLFDVYSPELISPLVLPALKGDFIFREGATEEQYRADLQSILTAHFHRPITCTFEDRTMNVIVLSGVFKLTPLPSAPHEHGPELTFYVQSPDPPAQFSNEGTTHDPHQFAVKLSEKLGLPVICEFTNFPFLLWYTYSHDTGKDIPLTDGDAALLLQHLSEQTSLTITRESRSVHCLVINPVNPRIDAAVWQGYPKTSPFQAVRWNADSPEVQIDNIWYQLHDVWGLRTEKIIAFAKQADPKDWQRRFEEDFIALLALMGDDLSEKKEIVLKIKNLSTGKIELRVVTSTKENRDAIHQALLTK